MNEKLECPIEKEIKFLANKWSLIIIKNLEEYNKLRFNELLKNIYGISPRTLSKRLVELEEENFILKEKFNEIPPRVEYSLTKKGHEFGKYLKDLNKLITKWNDIK